MKSSKMQRWVAMAFLSGCAVDANQPAALEETAELEDQAANPGNTLIQRLTRCDSQNASSQEACVTSATNAAMATVEWRARQVESSYDPAELTHRSRGIVPNLRREWNALCSATNGVASWCPAAANRSLNDAALDFSFRFMNEQVEDFRQWNVVESAAGYECAAALSSSLEELEDAQDERRAYARFRDCVVDSVKADASKRERRGSRALSTALSRVLNLQSAACEVFVTAGAFRSGLYFDDAEASVPQSRCEARMAGYAIKVLHQD